jgi:NADPH2 dehydrogenase
MPDSRRLFQPLRVGNVEVKHRLVLAPLTRMRATGGIPWDKAALYYAQRGTVPGTLLISEATFISEAAGGYPDAPGIYNAEQVKAWQPITKAVHDKGSFIYCQLWALGRASRPKVLKSLGHDLVSASDLPMDEKAPRPRALTTAEVEAYVQQYAKAAKLAVEAGFDGVELHGANGYLIDQFTQDVSNQRTDKYGGSIENRSRFALEAVRAVTEAIGAERTAIRLSPWSGFQGMRMGDRTIPQFSYLIKNLPKDLAYLHMTESRVQGIFDKKDDEAEKLNFALDLWKGPFVVAGGFRPELAIQVAEQDDRTMIAFGRLWIRNPMLPAQIKLGLPLDKYDRSTFYTKTEKGYTDYPVDESLLAKL